MSVENVDVNISLTGTQEAVADIKAYIRSLQEAGAVQEKTTKSAQSLAAGLSDAIKAMEDAAKAVGNLAKGLQGAQTEMARTAKAQKGAAASAGEAAKAFDDETKSVIASSDAMLKAAADADAKAAADRRAGDAALLQVQKLETQTRALVIQRDAVLANMAAHNNFVDRMANSAPRLSKFSLYIAGGLAGAMYEGIKQYTNFNKLMTQTFSQANVSMSKQKALTADVRKIAMDTGRSYNDVADALYRVASATSSFHGGAGATTRQLSALTRQAANLQVLGNVAGGANADAAARIIGAVANTNTKDFANIKDPTKKAAAIAATMNAIVGSGDIRMTDLISALGRGVLTSASSVGLSSRDAGAFIDLLTAKGTSGASAGTYVAHAFQLLAGSTTQNTKWQEAIGLKSGEMLQTMKTQGLGGAAQLLRSHMRQLVGTDYMFTGKGKNKLTGQAAAQYMMTQLGMDPRLVAEWSSGVFNQPDYMLNKQQKIDLQAIQQKEMTAMFGGGRQAMPLIALMNNPHQFASIVKDIAAHSNQATYRKDLNLALNTPAAREQQFMRKFQDQLMSFGKAMTPVWLGILKFGTDLLGFMGKFKGYWVELGAVMAGILAATGFKYAAKGLRGVQNSFGAVQYYNRKWTGRGNTIASHKWANMYADKNELMHGQKSLNQEAELRAINARIKAADMDMAAAKENMRAAGVFMDSATLMSHNLGYGPGKMGSQSLKLAHTQERLNGRSILNAEETYGVRGAKIIGVPGSRSRIHGGGGGGYSSGGVANLVSSLEGHVPSMVGKDAMSLAEHAAVAEAETGAKAAGGGLLRSAGGFLGRAAGGMGSLLGMGSLFGGGAEAGALGAADMGLNLVPGVGTALSLALPLIAPLVAPTIGRALTGAFSGISHWFSGGNGSPTATSSLATGGSNYVSQPKTHPGKPVHLANAHGRFHKVAQSVKWSIDNARRLRDAAEKNGDVNAVRTLNAQIASQKMIGLLDYKNPKEAARREAEMQVSQQIAAMGAAGGVTTGEAQYLRSLAYAKFGLAPSGDVEHVQRILGIPSATRALKQAGKYSTGTVGYNRLVAALAAHPRDKALAETLLQAETKNYYGQYGTNAKYGYNNWNAGIYSNSFAPNALGQRGEVGYAEKLMRRGGMRGQATQPHYADLRVAQHADTLKSKDYTYLADKATADHNQAAAADFKAAAEHAKQQATIIKQAADKMHEKLDAHISKEDMAALQQAITESNKALAGSISSAIVSGARSIISKK